MVSGYLLPVTPILSITPIIPEIAKQLNTEIQAVSKELAAIWEDTKEPQVLPGIWPSSKEEVTLDDDETEEEEEDIDWYAVATRARALRSGAFARVCKLCDEAEASMPHKDWPIASYRDILFS